MQNTFPGTDRSVIPLWLFQSARFPFFGSLMMTLLRQSSRTSAVAQHVFKRVVSCSMGWPPCFSISAEIISNPGAS